MNLFFVQCAELLLEPGADPAAPGGAVTLALCGTWDHPGPCRWPHQTLADWEERRGNLRVVFLADAAEETQVRDLIERALASGQCVGPDGNKSCWKLAGSAPGALNESEKAWGKKMKKGLKYEG